MVRMTNREYYQRRLEKMETIREGLICQQCGKSSPEVTFCNVHKICNKCRRKKDGPRHKRKPTTATLKTRLCKAARTRGRAMGLGGDITPADLDWPKTCPVLGTVLDYTTFGEERKHLAHTNVPSLDRWDNTKGYLKGNVYVISLRANELKRDATPIEMEKVISYMRVGVW